IIRSLKKLSSPEYGYVDVERHVREYDGGNASSSYRLKAPAGRQSDLEFENPPVTRMSPAPVTQGVTAPVTPGVTSIERPLVERPSPERCSGELHARRKRAGSIDRQQGQLELLRPAIAATPHGRAPPPTAGSRIDADWTPSDIDRAFAVRH